MLIRFLEKDEFVKTKDLAIEAFGDNEDVDSYYQNDIFDNRIAVTKIDDKIVSMIHLRRMILEFENRSESVWYILYVATKIEYRNLGLMNNTFKFVLENLKNEGERFTFLVPVNEKVYENIGFTNKWEFDFALSDILYADDGLRYCYGCILDNSKFEKPISIKSCISVQEINYVKFDEAAAIKYFDYFSVRPNKSYDSVPLDCFVWRNAVNTLYAIIDDRCLLMCHKSGDVVAGTIPFCRESELCYYFKLQERYFNEVLKIPFRAYLADNEGVTYLKECGLLDNYEIEADEDIFDYIYDGDDLRNLVGRKFSDKRNRINKFLKNYDNRWEYKSLDFSDSKEILEFLEEWYSKKTVVGKGVNLGDIYDAAATLRIEKEGITNILNSEGLMKKVKAGGIFVDGKLSAFSLGTYNKRENMAIIEIEKAFTDKDGLYQLINREFLRNEFPNAKLINREDDDGLPGLRKAKMTYNPILFEKRYKLLQKKY